MKRAITLLVAATFALAVTGCGDDADDRLTKAEFQDQANAICKAGAEEIDEAGDEVLTSESPTPDDVETYIDEVLIANVRGQLDDIEDLSPPEDMEAGVDELLSSARAALDEMEELTGEEIMATDDPFAEVNEQANALGLEECGSS